MNSIILVVYITFFASIVFCWRAISSIDIGILSFLGIINCIKEQDTILSRDSPVRVFFWSCCFLFGLQCIALLYTHNINEGIKNCIGQSSLIFIPLAAISNRKVLTSYWEKLMRVFIFMLCIGVAYCLLINTMMYLNGNHDSSLFTYHTLVAPLQQHAIQFSILIFISLIYLIALIKNQDRKYKIGIILLTIILSGFLLLLSSKLVFVFFICYIFYSIISSNPRSGRFILLVSLSFIILGGVLIFINNPIKSRFQELKTGVSIIHQQKFTPGDYFNGLQFRLLQWRFTCEILTENNRWTYGVSPGDAQAFLDAKYKATGMYTGDPKRGDTGFLGYHTHNQFLQSLLENGILGLVAFLLICTAYTCMIIKKSNKELVFLFLLLFIYCFTDAILESQYGLILFLFFPLLYYYSVNYKHLLLSTLP